MDTAEKKQAQYEVAGRLFDLIAKMPHETRRVLLQHLESGALDGLVQPSGRQYDRKKCLLTVDYATAERVFQRYIQDISKGGAFIETQEKLDVGEEVVLSITFSEEQNPFRIPAEVVRATKSGVGLRFRFASEVQETIITRLISDVKEYKKTS
jgi:Tfp pilus assembly protein PilZ